MTSRAGLALVLGALAWPTGVGNAQDGRLRARVVAWADSIERIEDTALLRGMHREALTRADSLRGDPEAELRLGLKRQQVVRIRRVATTRQRGRA